MYCKYCGKEVNDNAVFCPYCGKKIDVRLEFINTVKIGSSNAVEIIKNTDSKKSNKKIILIIFLVLVMACLSFGGYVYHQINKMYNLVDSGQFNRAFDSLNTINIKFLDDQLLEYIEAGKLYEDKRFSEAYKAFKSLESYRDAEEYTKDSFFEYIKVKISEGDILKANEMVNRDIMKNYEKANELIKEIKEKAYKKGVEKFKSGKYDEAVEYFKLSDTDEAKNYIESIKKIKIASIRS